MPLFYFAIVTRSRRFEDQEGTDLPSLELARQEAIKDARLLMSAAMLDGRDISGRWIEIQNEQGELLLSVPFSEAISSDE